MQYRKFGKCDFNVSVLGFGCMRLPILGGDYNKIDEKESVRIIRKAIDEGVNYIDTAYPYHGGNSEVLVGKALDGGYREKVKLATKMPTWLIKEYGDFDKYLNIQLDKLKTDSIDMYLLHALDKDRFNKMKEIGVYKFLDEAIKDGRIKHAGFSFHDDIVTFKKIVDDYNWSFCQIQYNYLDIDYQAGMEGLKYAAQRNLAVIIMEPLKGGKLAQKLPENVNKVFQSCDKNKTPAKWALEWIWNQPEVTLLLSGMNSDDQIDENVQTAENAIIGSMSEKELKVIEDARDEFRKLIKVGCTACEYCLPCPMGVNIPKNFSLYNSAFMYDNLSECIKEYRGMSEKERASACVECGKCEGLCPQHIQIRKHLKEAQKLLQ